MPDVIYGGSTADFTYDREDIAGQTWPDTGAQKRRLLERGEMLLSYWSAPTGGTALTPSSGAESTETGDIRVAVSFADVLLAPASIYADNGTGVRWRLDRDLSATIADLQANSPAALVGEPNGLLGLDAAGLAIPAQLGSGTPSATTVLHGDGVYRTPASAEVSGVLSAANAYTDAEIVAAVDPVNRKIADSVDVDHNVLDLFGVSGTVTLNLVNVYDADGALLTRGYRKFRIRPAGNITVVIGAAPTDPGVTLEFAVNFRQPATGTGPFTLTWDAAQFVFDAGDSPAAATGALSRSVYRFTTFDNTVMMCTSRKTFPPVGTVPSTGTAPIATAGAAGDGRLVLGWAVPANGGSPITNVHLDFTDTGGDAVTDTDIPVVAGNVPTAYTRAGLIPGHTYTVKTRFDNANGSSALSPASSAVTLGTSASGNMLPNTSAVVTTDPNPGAAGSGFEARVGCTVTQVVAPAGIVGNAVKLTSNNATAATSSLRTLRADVAVVAGQVYSAMFSEKAGAGGAGQTVNCNIIFFDAADAVISTVTGSAITSSSTTWQKALNTGVTAPAGAVKASVSIRCNSTDTGDEHQVGQLGFFPGTVTNWSAPGAGPGATMIYGTNLFGSKNFVDPRGLSPTTLTETAPQVWARTVATLGTPGVVKIFKQNFVASFSPENLVTTKRAMVCFNVNIPQMVAGNLDAALDSYLGVIQAGYVIYLVIKQEPGGEIASGAFTAAQFKAACGRLKDRVTAAYASGLLQSNRTVLVGPCLQAYDIQSGRFDYATWIADNQDYIGWDAYGNEGVYPTGGDNFALSGSTYPPADRIVNACADNSGSKPFLFPEVGASLRTQDVPSVTGRPIGSRRADWFELFFDTAIARGAFACIVFDAYNAGAGTAQRDHRLAAANNVTQFTIDDFEYQGVLPEPATTTVAAYMATSA